MPLIIDGYNLIHAIGLLPAEIGHHRYPPGKLEEARDSLLRLLVKGLSKPIALQTIVVFDALEPPEFLPNSYRVHGIRVLFARDYRDADELIIELVLAQPKTVRLTVVSSDHRIQTSARRRKALIYDSDRWYFGDMPTNLFTSSESDAKRKSANRQQSNHEKEETKPTVQSPEEQQYWANIFKTDL